MVNLLLTTLSFCFVFYVYALQFVLSLLANDAGIHFLGEVTLNDMPVYHGVLQNILHFDI
jgi:hypothetical protein